MQPTAPSSRPSALPTQSYDAIVVGARCAGASLALLLARAGHRVLVVDRATFPSDTVSAHAIQPGGVARLASWGLLDLLRSTGAPFVDTVRFDIGEVVLEGTPLPVDGITSLVAPRRHVFDDLMVEAARDVGAEVRTGVSVRQVIVEHGRVCGIVATQDGNPGGHFEARARIVVGADGRNSLVARSVDATVYDDVPATTLGVYTYYRGVELDAVELYPRPDRFAVAVPTSDDTVVISQGIATHLAAGFRADIGAGFDATLAALPDLAERVAAGERIERFRLSAESGGFLRVPHGPGWALVGDAGYHKDPITAQGMLDAFRDAELLAAALDAATDGELDEALQGYHSARDQAIGPMYAFTCDLARVHEPPPPEMLGVLQALAGNPDQIGRFLGLMAGSVTIPEFFAPVSVQAILGGASQLLATSGGRR